MLIEEKKRIADEADMIVNGYSYTYKDGNVQVVDLNLKNPNVKSML